MLSRVAPPYVFLYSFTIESINTKEHVGLQYLCATAKTSAEW